MSQPDRFHRTAKSMKCAEQTVRRLMLEGFLEPGETGLVPQRVRQWRVDGSRLLDDEIRRFLLEFPPLDTRELACEFGDFARAVKSRLTVPGERIRQAVSLLRGTEKTSLINVSRPVAKLIGSNLSETHATVISIQLRTTQETGYGELLGHIAHRCGFTRADMERFARLGVLNSRSSGRDELSGGTDLEPSTAKVELLRRIRALAGGTYSPGRISDARRALLTVGGDREADFPLGLVEECVDFHLEHGTRPDTSKIHSATYCSRSAIRTILARRAREGQDVAPVKIYTSHHDWTRSEAEKLVHPALLGAPGTVFGSPAGDEALMPTDASLTALAGMQHEELRRILEVVLFAISGNRDLKSYRKTMHVPFVRHEPFFDGLSPTEAGDVNRVLTMRYMVGLTDAHPSAMMRDITLWSQVVKIYENYETNSLLSPQLRAHLAQHRPALPIGDDRIIGKAHQRYDALQTRRMEDDTKRIQWALDNVDGLRLDAEQRRNTTKRLRRRVAEALDTCSGYMSAMPEGDRSISFDFVGADDAAPPGRRKTRIALELLSWTRVLDLIDEVDPKVHCKQRSFIEALAKTSDRFEDRWALRFAGATHEDGSEAEVPHWFRFHIAQIFRQRMPPDEATAHAKAALLAEIGMPSSYLKGLPPALGKFSRRHGTIAANARDLLGMILLPLDEHDHLESFAIYCQESRVVHPIRPGEHIAFRFDEAESAPDGTGNVVLRTFCKDQIGLQDFEYDDATQKYVVEFVETTSRRLHGGQPAPASRRPGGAIEGSPDHAHYISGYGDGSLSTHHADIGVACLLAGMGPLTGKDYKKIWNAAAIKAGLDIEERQKGHRHKYIKVTRRHYDRETSETRLKRRDLVKAAISAGGRRPDTKADSERLASIADAEAEAAEIRKELKACGPSQREALRVRLAVVQRGLREARKGS